MYCIWYNWCMPTEEMGMRRYILLHKSFPYYTHHITTLFSRASLTSHLNQGFGLDPEGHFLDLNPRSCSSLFTTETNYSQCRSVVQSLPSGETERVKPYLCAK